MLADTSKRVVLLDARLSKLAELLEDATASNNATMVGVLRKRIDTVLDSRLSARHDEAWQSLAADVANASPDRIVRTR